MGKTRKFGILNFIVNGKPLGDMSLLELEFLKLMFGKYHKPKYRAYAKPWFGDSSADYHDATISFTMSSTTDAYVDRRWSLTSNDAAASQ